MKQLVFWLALAGIPVLSCILSVNRRWLRWAFFAMVAGVCLMEQTSINFFSRESYRGSARGMEVTLIHLMALAVLGALAIRGQRQRLFPEGGIRVFAFYFLLCVPGLFNADSVQLGWGELWKMMMMFMVWHAVYGYLAATDDTVSIVKVLALVVLVNFWYVLRQHYGGVHMARGFFPHRNSMSMAMNLLGPLCFGGYLLLGPRNRLGRWCTAAFPAAVLSTMWSYSRGAIAMVPVGYGITALACLLGAKRGPARTWVLARMVPILLAGLMGLVAIWPHLVERFSTENSAHKQSSKDTRIVLALMAWEMIKEHPWAGVGINNWSCNLTEAHPYRDRVEERLDRELYHNAIVETVYLLVGAECGIPALLGMLAWFVWHWASCLGLAWRLRGSEWQFVPAGLLGGFSADYTQSVLEWVLRQKTVLVLLVICFGLVAYMRLHERKGRKAAPERAAEPEGAAA